ncbi:MAG: response regulator transcription factor [Chitinophagaceae bacterium]
MTKIFIVDDHTVVIEGIYSLLQNEKDMEVLGYATNAGNCLSYIPNHAIDVILMDISLPDMNGTDLCKIIKRKHPGIMILALSTFNQGSYIRKMVENGASGYLLKNAGRQEIIDAIRIVVKGQSYFTFDAGQALKSDTQQQSIIPLLTKREKEVLRNIAEGLTNSQISEKLFISIDTVESHRKNLHTKLNVKNTAMLIRFAVENNLL